MMVDKRAGEALTLRLEKQLGDLCFCTASPGLENPVPVLAWKKNQVFSPATAAFIRHVKNVSEKNQWERRREDMTKSKPAGVTGFRRKSLSEYGKLGACAGGKTGKWGLAV